MTIRRRDLILDVVETVIPELPPGCTTVTKEYGVSEEEVTVTLQPRSGNASRIMIGSGPHARSVFVELGEATTVELTERDEASCGSSFMTY